MLASLPVLLLGCAFRASLSHAGVYDAVGMMQDSVQAHTFIDGAVDKPYPKAVPTGAAVSKAVPKGAAVSKAVPKGAAVYKAVPKGPAVQKAVPKGVAVQLSKRSRKSSARKHKSNKPHIVKVSLMKITKPVIAKKLASMSLSKRISMGVLKRYSPKVHVEWKVHEVENVSSASLVAASKYCSRALDGTHSCTFPMDDPKRSAAFNLTLGKDLDGDATTESEIAVKVGLMEDKTTAHCPVCGPPCAVRLLGMSQKLPAPPCPLKAGTWVFKAPLGSIDPTSIPVKTSSSLTTTVRRADGSIAVKYSFTVKT